MLNLRAEESHVLRRVKPPRRSEASESIALLAEIEPKLLVRYLTALPIDLPERPDV